MGLVNEGQLRHVHQPLLLLFGTAFGSVQSLTSQMTIVSSLPPVTNVGLSLYVVNAEASMRPSCALKDAMVS
jgi:hypothetical protein